MVAKSQYKAARELAQMGCVSRMTGAESALPTAISVAHSAKLWVSACPATLPELAKRAT